MAQDLGNVLICGLGKSAGSAALWCADHLKCCEPKDGFLVQSLTIYAGPKSESAKAYENKIKRDGVSVIYDTEDIEGNFDLAIKSPGISVFSDFYKNAAAASSEVICEPELAYRVSPQNWVGVTGTNGKTTTTTLTASLFESAGIGAHASGNIGLPCIDAIQERASDDYIVAELSSFQLASMHTFAPDAAILLNITPDHVEWHKTLEHYANSKIQIFKNQTPDQFAIIDCTAKNTRQVALDLMKGGHSVIVVGGPEGLEQDYLPIDEFDNSMGGFFEECDCEHLGSAYVRDGQLMVDIDGELHELAYASDLKILGGHNLQNALCAAAAAIACGVSDEDVARGLVMYRPMEHRVEPCGTVSGVRYYNDSKATNTDAAAKALTAFDAGKIVLLLGGHDKGTDLTDLVQDCLEKCKAVVCFGEAKDRFYDAFSKAKQTSNFGCALLEAPHLKEALEVASKAATEGDVVLLSPACSSFDEFGSFVERGNVFKQLVSDMFDSSRANQDKTIQQ